MKILTPSTQDLPSRIRQSLDRCGYHHEPQFGTTDDGRAALVGLARRLGLIFVPDGFDSKHPVLVTNPSCDAPRSQPFDRPEGIGWHNDFSTFLERPSLTLIWIAQQDPGGENLGAWRVASVADVLKELARDPAGQQILFRMRSEDFAVGYEGSMDPLWFRLLEPFSPSCHQEMLRFYGRSLREGIRSIRGLVPTEVEQTIVAVEQAADTVGKTLPATNYALLVVDNRRALHDRTVQTTDDARALRRAILCFVR